MFRFACARERERTCVRTREEITIENERDY